MATLLFSLRGVPEDEAEEVRELLTEHSVDFYETNAGNWGVSMPALWLRSEDELFKARQLLDVYQVQRATQAREHYLQLKAEGQHLTFFKMLKERPLQLLIYLCGIALTIYVSIRLLFELGL
ncbi:MAG: hypothetical protein D0528_09320 [Methylococcales bacterium]|nr:MAG: hypothetical protein D0528_09320 [Methylococcales bacterium]